MYPFGCRKGRRRGDKEILTKTAQVYLLFGERPRHSRSTESIISYLLGTYSSTYLQTLGKLQGRAQDCG